MSKLKKYIRPATMKSIKSGEPYEFDNIKVWFGIDLTYDRSVDHVLEIVKNIQREYPNASVGDMEIHQITDTISNRHAGMTMVNMNLPSELVINNLDQFDEL